MSFLGTVFQCSACDTIFMQPRRVIEQGFIVHLCANPACDADSQDWDQVDSNMIWIEFIAILAESFTEERRMNLRVIAEEGMGPYNRLTRDL